MSRCINPLPRILEEREFNGEVLALESQMPAQIQKVSWTNNNVSPEWLKRMSSVFAFNTGINGNISNVAPVSRPKRVLQHWNTNNCHQTSPNDVLTQSDVFNECDERSGSEESFTANLSAGDETTTPRKPDSTYITLISGITDATSPSPSSVEGLNCAKSHIGDEN